MSNSGSKLGGLPSLSYGPVTLAQQQVVYNPDAARPFDDLATAAENIGKMFQPALEEKAAAQGAAQVTRDAQGNLQAGERHTVITAADLAYENARKVGYLSRSATDIRTQMGQLQAQHPEDPDGFARSLDGLITGATKNAPPEFQQPITEMALREGAAIQSDLQQQKIAGDITRARGAIDAHIDQTKNALIGFALQNRGDDPQAQVLRQELDGQYRIKAANPALNYSPEAAKQDYAEFLNILDGNAALGLLKNGTPGIKLFGEAVGITAKGGVTSDQIAALEGSGPTATSPKGAIGQHQIMPATAQQYGLDQSQLTNPAYSSQAANKIIADLSRQAGGDRQAILAGYNAGPAWIPRVLGAGPGTQLQASRDASGRISYQSVPAARNESFLPKETQQYLARDRMLTGAGSAAPQAQTGVNETEQTILNLPNLSPSERITLINRAEAIWADKQTMARQADADATRQLSHTSDIILKNMYDANNQGRLTTSLVSQFKDSMTAEDYSVAQEMARGGHVGNNSDAVSTLLLENTTTAPEGYRKIVAQALALHQIEPGTAMSLISSNATAYKEGGGPPTPYQQGRDFVRSSLDPGPAIRDYGGRQAQANAIVDYDNWSAQNPKATQADAHLAAQNIVQRYSLINAAQLPLAMGRPYGFGGNLSGINPDVVKSSALKLKQALQAGRIGQGEYQDEVNRLKAWNAYIAKQAEKAKAPQ